MKIKIINKILKYILGDYHKRSSKCFSVIGKEIDKINGLNDKIETEIQSKKDKIEKQKKEISDFEETKRGNKVLADRFSAMLDRNGDGAVNEEDAYVDESELSCYPHSADED